MNGVSLFSNVGIAETYIHKAGINIVVANELDKKRAEFHKHLYPNCEMIQGDITDGDTFTKVLRKAKELKCDFLIATPPCQGMSIAGKLKENDPRNTLIKYVVKMIQQLEPTNAIIENVRGALSTYILVNKKRVKMLEFIKNELLAFGYVINPMVLDAADYGTPQTRVRAFFLLSKLGKWEAPKKSKQISLYEAIGHLPSLESGGASDIPFHQAKGHSKEQILCLQHTPTGKSALENTLYFPKKADGTKVKGYPTSYKRMEWNRPAPTITMANGYISSQNNVHPGRVCSDGTYSDARVLTLKEVFILTGLPDEWKPPQWASEQLVRKVIGEGVPPKLILSILSNMPKPKQ